MKVADADVTISNMSVAPEYRYDREDQKQVFVGNVYRRQIKLRFRKLTDLAKMIGTLPAAKEVLIDTGEFESSRADEVRRNLIAQAVQDARLTGDLGGEPLGLPVVGELVDLGLQHVLGEPGAGQAKAQPAKHGQI